MPASFCPTCGARRWDDARFCGTCGRDLSTLLSVAQEGPPADAGEPETSSSPPSDIPPFGESYDTVEAPAERAWIELDTGAEATRPGWVAPLVVLVIIGLVGVGGFFAVSRLRPAATGAAATTPAASPTGIPSTPRPTDAAAVAAPPGAGGSMPSIASARPQPPAGWQPAAPLAVARWGQGAVTLEDGRVFVVGGTSTTSSAGALSSAELYDPTMNRWQNAAPMHEARAYPLVVLLTDGRVLVAGGARDEAPLASSEIYDPGTNSWSVGPRMTTPRSDFAGVRLADGKVLVLGGATTATSGAATRSAEIFNPTTNRWSATASMHAARAYPTATLLPDGRVLVVGGASTYVGSGNVVGTAELFNPSSGSWTETGPLLVPVYGHSATLLANGDVLVTGGWSSRSASASAIATAQLFDPRSNTWSATSPMAVARADARTVALPDGRVVVVGGLSADNNPLSSAEIYEPTTASWTTLPSTDVAEWWGTLALLPSGDVLLAGGSADSSGSAPLRDAETLHLAGGAP